MRDVAPLPDRNLPPQPSRVRPVRLAGERPTVHPTPPVSPPATPQLLDGVAGVDRATADKLKRGRYPIEATLDLHGMTQDEAHRALTGFVAVSRAAGRRCVLVITGHGRTSGGVLKAAVPRWLAEPGLHRHVLALAPARPQHGAAGALYVLLRRVSP